MEEVGTVVVGAGVVGLAIARALALAGHDVLILDAADAIGTGISSRNSEVIHAGLYYPPGSLKARLCVEGRDRLYAYCRQRGVAHRQCGKLIVATGEGQEVELERIAASAEASGAGALQPLTAREAMAMEPALSCTAALLSPKTGIVDASGLMLALLGDAEAAGAQLGLNTAVASARVDRDRIVLTTRDVATGQDYALTARALVNAAGLGAVELAASLDGLDARFVPTLRLAKGNYFSVEGRAPFSRLVYPVPEPGGLGVHLTLALDGMARFGPDVEWIDAIDYRVDPARADRFYGAIRRYWPGLRDGALQPAYAGIRPKLSGPGEPNVDFRFDGPEVHGIPGLANLFGIESPGLTASLAIAELVAGRLPPP
jgi:L-2-hydroxyglutarate oxidase LhgO